MVLVKIGRSYVVYDSNEKIIIITSNKNIAKAYARVQHGSKETRRSK